MFLSTAVNATVVAKPEIVGILSYILLIFALIFLRASLIFWSRPDLSTPYWVFKANTIVSTTFTFVTNLSCKVFFNNIVIHRNT